MNKHKRQGRKTPKNYGKGGQMRKFQFVGLCVYDGHSIDKNCVVSLRLKTKYSELQTCVKLMQALNNDILVKVKSADNPAFSLGTWRLKRLNIDHDGEGKITLSSSSDFVETDNVNMLSGFRNEEIKFHFSFEVEIENEME